MPAHSLQGSPSHDGSAPPGARPTTNRILAALPDADYERISLYLKRSDLASGQPLFETGAHIERVWFLSAGMVSSVLFAESGAGVEVGIMGREGMTGYEVALDGGGALTSATVQIAGHGHSLAADVFKTEFERGGALHSLVLRSLQEGMAQIAQTVLCNRLHSVEERLSRWLLMVSDRIESDELELTQEFIAQMLGARRSGVTVAAGILKQAGLISYKRGCITILDREGLEESTCECHAIIERRYSKFLGDYERAARH